MAQKLTVKPSIFAMDCLIVCHIESLETCPLDHELTLDVGQPPKATIRIGEFEIARQTFWSLEKEFLRWKHFRKLTNNRLWLKVARGCGSWGLGTRGRVTWGRVDSGARGLGDASAREVKTLGLRDVGRKEWGRDKQATPDLSAEFVKYNFRCSRGRYYMLEFISRLVADDFRVRGSAWYVCLPILLWKFWVRNSFNGGGFKPRRQP